METETHYQDVAGSPETVEAALLGDADRIVAVLDANRIPNLPEILETQNLPHMCLFQGQLAQEARDVAPWIVELARGDTFLRQLVSRAEQSAFGYLDREPGLYLHTEMQLRDIRRHLRRFLRVTIPDGRIFLFRFWEPAIAAIYFGGLDDRPDLVWRWFRGHHGAALKAIKVLQANADAVSLSAFAAKGSEDARTAPMGAFALSDSDLAGLQVARMEGDMHDMESRLTQSFPDAAAALSAGALDALLRRTISRMMQFGFHRKSILFTIAAWELHYGPQFETRDPEGRLRAILAAPGPEALRFAQLKARMAELG